MNTTALKTFAPAVRRQLMEVLEMNPRFLFVRWLAVLSASVYLFAGSVTATVDGFGEFAAMQAIDPYIKQGYTLREDTWGGDLAVGETKVVTCQLFKGNDYVFVASSENKSSKISVHIYDENGNLAESKSWQQTLKVGSVAAGARAQTARTGNYRIVVKIEAANGERVDWGMVYAYK